MTKSSLALMAAVMTRAKRGGQTVVSPDRDGSVLVIHALSSESDGSIQYDIARVENAPSNARDIVVTMDADNVSFSQFNGSFRLHSEEDGRECSPLAAMYAGWKAAGAASLDEAAAGLHEDRIEGLAKGAADAMASFHAGRKIETEWEVMDRRTRGGGLISSSSALYRNLPLENPESSDEPTTMQFVREFKSAIDRHVKWEFAHAKRSEGYAGSDQRRMASMIGFSRFG